MKILYALALAGALLIQKDPTASEASAVLVTNGVAIYATLSNPTMYDAYVQSGKSDAGKVELREGDPSTPLAAGKPTSNITIPSFGSVELKAGGPYVLLTELKGQPKAGDTITAVKCWPSPSTSRWVHSRPAVR